MVLQATISCNLTGRPKTEALQMEKEQLSPETTNPSGQRAARRRWFVGNCGFYGRRWHGLGEPTL